MTENLYTPNCIRTFTGQYVNVFEPDPETIKIEDIAHSLARQCRFGGHLPNFYSVAQHSLNCAYITDNKELKLAALLHDASEAYLLDIPRPIKSGLTNYKEIEDKLMMVIANKFGFEYPLPVEVKKVDEIMLETEWYALMLRKPLASGMDLVTYDMHITEKTFLTQYHYLNTKAIYANMQ